jgi:hypothetical protein
MRPTVGRGLATADFDNDGDTDIAVSNSNDYPQILRNDGGNANNWLEVMLVGNKSNRDGRGAALKLTTEGFTEYRQALGGTSYLSASDPRIAFGLGRRKTIESLEITWPSGIVDRLANVPINRIITVKEGVGIIPRKFPRINWKYIPFAAAGARAKSQAPLYSVIPRSSLDALDASETERIRSPFLP